MSGVAVETKEQSPLPSERKESEDAKTTDESEKLSRGQKKRLAKREQYLRREKMVMSALKLKRQEDQKKRIDGLDAIREALLDTVKEANEDDEKKDYLKPNFLKSNKSRQKLFQKEVGQMQLVLEHPQFKADPLSTIREHLQNTLSKDIDRQQKEHTQHLKERDAKERERKAHKKEQGIKKKKSRFRATRTKR